MKLTSKFRQSDAFWPLIFITFAVFLRLISLGQPILEGANTRQIQTADITYNLFNNSFNFLYPQISILPEPRYFLIEPPIYNSIVAALYKVFGVHEELGRLVSIFAFAGTAYFIFIISLKHVHKGVANSAVFVFCFSPLSIIYTRSFQPDTLALFFLTALVFFVKEWFEGKEKAFWPALFFGLFAFLSKQTFMFILISFLLMGLILRGKQILLEKRIYIFTILTAIPSIIWTFHSRKTSKLFPNNFYSENFDFSNWISLPTFLNYEFYKTIFLWLSGIILTPIGFTLFLIGLFIKITSKENALLKTWLAGVFIFDLIFHKHAFTHEYYHLPLLPVASIIIGKAWWFLFESNNLASNNTRFHLKPFKLFILGIATIMAMGYANSAFKLPSYYYQIEDKIKFFDNHINDNELVISSTWEALYFSRNKGWLFLNNEKELKKDYIFFLNNENYQNLQIFLLEKFRKNGASYFFAFSSQKLYKNKTFADYLESTYLKTADKKSNAVLFDLRKKIS